MSAPVVAQEAGTRATTVTATAGTATAAAVPGDDAGAALAEALGPEGGCSAPLLGSRDQHVGTMEIKDKPGAIVSKKHSFVKIWFDV